MINDKGKDTYGYPQSTIKQKKLKPEWRNAPTVELLNKDIRNAEPDFNEHVNDVKKYLDLRDGRLKIKPPKGKSKVSPKVIRKMNEWRYSSLSEPFLANDDLFDVDPATYNDKLDAVENAKILNKQFRSDIDRERFIDEYIRAAVDEGLVFVRVGWEYEEETITVQQAEMQMMPITQDPNEMQRLDMAIQAGQMDPEQAMTQVATGRMIEVEKQVTTVNRPTVEVVLYDRILLDPNARGDMDNARFIAYQWRSSYSELKALDKYENLDAITRSSDIDSEVLALADDHIDETTNFDDRARKEFWVTEYWGDWDIHDDGTTVPIVATYVGKTMISLEENPFPDGKPPFVMVPYLPKRNTTYPGEPDAVLIEDNQDVIGAVTRGMIDLMGKSANSQQGISADALDPAQKLRFEQGKDFIFNPGIDPTKAFFMGTYPEIPRSAMEMIQLQNNDAESLLGVKAFAEGISGQALGSNVGGIRSALDATAKRELGILRRLSKGIVKIGEKIALMNTVNLDDEEIQKITDGQVVNINRDQKSIPYDLKISVSTPEKDAEKAQDLSFMLQTIGNNMDPSLQQMILSEIATLKDMPVLAKKLIDWKPQPDPMEQQIKQLQVALLEAQVKNEQAKGMENQADVTEKKTQAELNAAKAEVERAKVRSLHSSADMEDLKFIQEQEGTKHAQDLEKEAAKHAMNKDKSAQDFDHELGKKAVDSMLDKETPRVKPSDISKYPSQNFPRPEHIQGIGGSDGIPAMDLPQLNLDQQLQP